MTTFISFVKSLKHSSAITPRCEFVFVDRHANHHLTISPCLLAGIHDALRQLVSSPSYRVLSVLAVCSQPCNHARRGAFSGFAEIDVIFTADYGLRGCTTNGLGAARRAQMRLGLFHLTPNIPSKHFDRARSMAVPCSKRDYERRSFVSHHVGKPAA